MSNQDNNRDESVVLEGVFNPDGINDHDDYDGDDITPALIELGHRWYMSFDTEDENQRLSLQSGREHLMSLDTRVAFIKFFRLQLCKPEINDHLTRSQMLMLLNAIEDNEAWESIRMAILMGT